MRQFLFTLVEFDGRADRVGGATAELPLIVNRRATAAQVDRRRQSTHLFRCAEQPVARIGQIGNPSIAAKGVSHAPRYSAGSSPPTRATCIREISGRLIVLGR